MAAPMLDRPGLKMSQHSAKKAGLDEGDVEYHAILATLARLKSKERVPPSQNTKWYLFDKCIESRYPKDRGTAISRDKPPKKPYPCKLDCETCFTQTFPVRISVTDAEALAGVQTLSTAIWDDLAYLRNALSSYADAIVTRWRKKSKEKRAQLFTALAPKQELDGPLAEGGVGTTLYPEKWAAIHLINERCQDHTKIPPLPQYADDPRMRAIDRFVMTVLGRMGEEYSTLLHQTTWLLPYLDIETLAENPLLFLGLLHYRTVHGPEEWMMFDNSQLKLGENFGVLIPEFNRHCVTMHGDKYGAELVDWDTELSHRWQIVGYQKAQHILSAQYHMMQFLRRTVQTLLDEMQLSQDAALAQKSNKHGTTRTASPKWDQLVLNNFFSFGSSPAQSTSTFANQPFLAPRKWDPVKTVELVQSLYQQSVDELDIAQTDPAYMQYLVRELADSAYFVRMDEPSRWDWFMDEIPCNLYRRLSWWRQMLKECRLMETAYQAYCNTPTPWTRRVYEEAVVVILDIATEHLAQQTLLMKYCLPFQRDLERNYQWGEVERYEGGQKLPTTVDRDFFHEDKLFWSLRCFGFDEHRMMTMDPSFHFRVLEDHLSGANHKERNRISAQLQRQLSEMAAVDGIRATIECSQYWGLKDLPRTQPCPKFRRDFLANFVQNMSLPEIIDKSQMGPLLRTLCKDTPWPKGQMDSRWLDRATASRGQLTRLWKVFRDALKSQQQRRGWPKDSIDEDFAALSAAERPESLAAIEEEKRFVLERIEQRKLAKVQNISSPIPQSSPLVDRTSLPEKFTAPVIKEKKKTRPSENSADETSPAKHPVTSPPEVSSPPATDPPSKEHLVAVKPENLGLFAQMFAGAGEGQTRSYSWVHFLQAMADAGFSVTHRGGSAVSFENDRGVIVFHRPHPEPNIDPVMLSSMGKRLRKWFGWSGDSFVARTKLES